VTTFRVKLAGGEGGSPEDHDTVEALPTGAVTMERDTGFKPMTFSLGKRKWPFPAVTGSAK
jgi:hypothetical protein